MNTITVRRVNGKNCNTVIPGIVHVFRDDEKVPWHRYDDCLAWVTRRVERGFYSTLAYESDTITGFSEWIEMYDAGKKILYLGMMQVDCALRGKGIGGAMLADGEAYAKSIGASCLRTIPEDERAYAFYQKYGFRETDCIYSCTCPTRKGSPAAQRDNAGEIPLAAVNTHAFIFGLCQSSGRHMYEVANHNPDACFKVKTSKISDGYLQFRYQEDSKTALALYWSDKAATGETVSEILMHGQEQGFEAIEFYFRSTYAPLFSDFDITRESTEMEKELSAMDAIGNYARHAAYWEWGKLDHDRTPDDETKYKFAKQYGNRILLPMCAWGHLGAYMAERGMQVTAFDITPEMIAEGKKHFGTLENLNLFVGDASDFSFDIEPVDICAFGEFGWIHSMDEVKKALVCMHNHLRDGGYLILDESIDAHDSQTELETFRVKNNPYPDRTVYKTGTTRNEAKTRRCYISQTMYIDYHDGRKEQFDHAFYLQGYAREEWLAALAECGFEVVAAYKNYEKEPWHEGEGRWIVEAKKAETTQKRYSPAVNLDHLQTPIYRYENVELYNDNINLQQPNDGYLLSYFLPTQTAAPQMHLRHHKISLPTDRDYICERHCAINYACDTPWARKLPYETYRTNWFTDTEGYLSALAESMKDERTIAEIIKTEAGEPVGYVWVVFHAEDTAFIWSDVQDIFVEEPYRRTGVAAYLLVHQRNLAKSWWYFRRQPALSSLLYDSKAASSALTDDKNPHQSSGKLSLAD